MEQIYILMQCYMFLQTLPWANVTFPHTYFLCSDVTLHAAHRFGMKNTHNGSIIYFNSFGLIIFSQKLAILINNPG